MLFVKGLLTNDLNLSIGFGICPANIPPFAPLSSAFRDVGNEDPVKHVRWSFFGIQVTKTKIFNNQMGSKYTSDFTLIR